MSWLELYLGSVSVDVSGGDDEVTTVFEVNLSVAAKSSVELVKGRKTVHVDLSYQCNTI